MEIMKRHLLTLLALVAMLALTACGDDEPDVNKVDYIVSVEAELQVNGTTSDHSNYLDPVTLMKDAVRSVYPKADTEGADDAVLAACNKCYQEYVEMYTGYPDNITCTINLVRATLDNDGKVRQLQTMMTYVYDINPIIVE